MTDFRHDGGGQDTPQAGLRRVNNSNPVYDFPYLMEGVIVGIHYPSEPESKSRTELEYDVDPTSMHGLPRLYNVPRADLFGGLDDRDDSILRVAQWNADGKHPLIADTTPGLAPTPRYETDGDRVLIGFVNGNYTRPVIVGVLSHFHPRLDTLETDVSGNPLPKDGKRYRRVLHRGTELLLDEKGNLALTFAKLPDAKTGTLTTDQKKLTITIGDFVVVIDNTSSPTTLSIQNSNGDSLLQVTGTSFEVGSSGLEPMVLGQTLTTFLNDVVTKFAAHTHVTPSGAAAPIIPAQGITASTAVTSTWAKVSKSSP
jgi:hypothetical protein